MMETRKQKMDHEMQAFELRAKIEEADAEDEAYAQVKAEEAGQKTPAPPATTTMPLATTTVPPTALSLPLPLSAAAETTLQQQTQNVSSLEFVSETYMRESASPRAVAGGAIPKRPPPGLQPLAAGNAHVSSDTDNIRVLPASYAEVAYRGTSTAVLDTERTSPALIGGVPVPRSASGYDQRISSLGGAVGMDNVFRSSVARPPIEARAAAPHPELGYYPEIRWCPPISYVRDSVNMDTPPVTASREQAIGTSAGSADTHSDTTRPCTDQLAQFIGVQYKLQKSSSLRSAVTR